MSASLSPNLASASDEALRLRTLRQYDILYSLHEEVFDEFVALTARIFSLPISLITLVDETHVWHKASYGLPDCPPIPRAKSACSTAIERRTATVYADLTIELPQVLDATTPLKETPRFYAGAPLRMLGQYNIGMLCVVDRKPRRFSTDEQQVLQQIAELVSQTIVVRHHCRYELVLGEKRWQRVQAQVLAEVQGLHALVRYLVARHGIHVPVLDAVLISVSHRLHDLKELLDQYC